MNSDLNIITSVIYYYNIILKQLGPVCIHINNFGSQRNTVGWLFITQTDLTEEVKLYFRFDRRSKTIFSR